MEQCDNTNLIARLEEREAELRARNRELQALTNNIPGGVFRCYFDKDLTIQFMSEGFLAMFGYTRTEISERFHDSFWQMIHLEDRELALATATEQLRYSNNKEIEYRVTRADGSLVWVLDKGQLVKSGDSAVADSFYCILVDVTSAKLAQAALKMSLERHQIIMNQTTDILFEWDIVRDTMGYSPNFHKKFGFDPVLAQLSTEIPRRGRLDLADLRKFENLLHGCWAGKPYQQEEMRIRDVRDRVIWCRVRVSTQCDMQGTPVKAVGVIVDIDAEMRKNQSLMDRAERDALTGLYNRGAAQSLVEELLTRNAGDRIDALLLIDVDNFKQVNDTRGHLFGDAVLAAVASGMKKIFTDALIARIGGDEFMVYLNNIPSEAFAQEQGERVLETFRGILSGQLVGGEVTCSIGGCFSPRHGKSFHLIYHNADIALYEAKNRGKSRCVFFDEKMQETHPFGVASPLRVNTQIDSEQQHGGLGNRLVEYVFGVLYQSSDTNLAVSLMLEIVGKQFDVSRVYIFEESEDRLSVNNTFEWCNENIPSEKEHLQEVTYEYLDNYYGNFTDGIFYCRDIEELSPPQARILRNQGIKAVLQCAIRDQGVAHGFVGFDECRRNCFWTQEQVDALTLIAEILSTFLMKQRAQERLERAAKKMSLVLENQNTFIYAVDRDNFELRFLNRRTMQLVPDAQLGKCCYEVFFHRKNQCETCPVRGISPGQSTNSMEVYNPVLDVWTMADASLVDWEGRDAVLLTCHNITRYKNH